MVRACQLLRLFHETSRFEVMLNRRMSNGVYGGVSGEIKFSLLTLYQKILHGYETKGNSNMRFFNFKTSESKEDIIWKFNRLRASEQHKIFAFFDNYYNNRIGLHTYVNGDKVTGYYESGKLTRHESLGSIKAWFYGKLVEKNGVCQFRGIIVYSTIPIEIFGIIQFIYEPRIIWPILFLIYTFYVFCEEEKTYECIKEIIS